MRVPLSWLGCLLSSVHVAAAVYVVQDELRHKGGGWINLRGLGTLLITLPSQLTVGVALKWLGVPAVNFDDPGAGGYCQLLIHVLVTAALIYLIGAGVEWVFRRWLLPQAMS